mgnify:CR=1 FL=1
MKREAITLYTTKHKRLQYQHVFPCGVCPKLWDNQFPDYLTLSPFKLAIELVRKVMTSTTLEVSYSNDVTERPKKILERDFKR